MVFAGSANAARGGEKKAEPTPHIYTKKTQKQFNDLAFEELSQGADPFTSEQLEELRELMIKRDGYLYDQSDTLEVKNAKFVIKPGVDKIIKIKLGHTYNTTVVFTDALGNPWGFETLTSISDEDTVSFLHPVPNIMSLRPKVKAGQSNLAIKMNGTQSPITILFEIGSDEVYFNADVRVDGLGDSVDSDRRRSVDSYLSGGNVPPKLNEEPAKELMLQFITPDGYVQRDLFDEYGEKVDSRDFVAWSNGKSLFVMTPHSHYTPEPFDISAASDGRHKLLEYTNQSVLLLRKNSKVIMLYIR